MYLIHLDSYKKDTTGGREGGLEEQKFLFHCPGDWNPETETSMARCQGELYSWFPHMAETDRDTGRGEEKGDALL